MDYIKDEDKGHMRYGNRTSEEKDKVEYIKDAEDKGHTRYGNRMSEEKDKLEYIKDDEDKGHTRYGNRTTEQRDEVSVGDTDLSFSRSCSLRSPSCSELFPEFCTSSLSRCSFKREKLRNQGNATQVTQVSGGQLSCNVRNGRGHD